MRLSRQEYWSGVAISFSKESSEPWDQTHISGLLHLAGRFFTTSTTSDIHVSYKNIANTSYFENKQIKEQNCNNLESLFQFSRNLTNISYHTNLGLNIAVKKLFFFFLVFQKLNLSLPKMSTTSLIIFLKNPFFFIARPQRFSGLK